MKAKQRSEEEEKRKKDHKEREKQKMKSRVASLKKDIHFILKEESLESVATGGRLGVSARLNLTGAPGRARTLNS